MAQQLLLNEVSTGATRPRQWAWRMCVLSLLCNAVSDPQLVPLSGQAGIELAIHFGRQRDASSTFGDLITRKRVHSDGIKSHAICAANVKTS